jgi:DNA-binding NtrC family response regulator
VRSFNVAKPRALLIDVGNHCSLCETVRAVIIKQFDVHGSVVRLDSESQPCDFELGAKQVPSGAFLPYVTILFAPPAPNKVGSIIQSLRRELPQAPVLLVVDSTDTAAVRQMLGEAVEDFVTPPLKEVELLPRLWRLLARQREEPETVKRTLRRQLGLRRLVGESQAFLAAVERIPIYAKYDGTVLIEGETGTGKELVARAIHHLSPRAGKAFVPVDCGAIPPQLVENELFGHVRGAFTGATVFHQGLVHEAEGGTLFLDEIDALPPVTQVKFLRLLQEREYRPLGSTVPMTADIRVIAATNSKVEQLVRRRSIREDLYYRLSVLRLRLPPLRDRRQDIVLLARHLAAKHARRINRPIPAISPGAIHRLLQHEWPGNVRELEHVIERALLLSEQRLLITERDVELGSPDVPAETVSFKRAKAEAVSRFEQSYIENMLATYHGNISQAAAAARKNRRAFWELMRKHGIRAEPFRQESIRAANPPTEWDIEWLR